MDVLAGCLDSGIEDEVLDIFALKLLLLGVFIVVISIAFLAVLKDLDVEGKNLFAQIAQFVAHLAKFSEMDDLIVNSLHFCHRASLLLIVKHLLLQLLARILFN